jgi:hypothetical protein
VEIHKFNWKQLWAGVSDGAGQKMGA